MGYTIDLTGQVAIVTGAASGIGAGIALKLAEAGAQVVICDIKDSAEAASILDQTKEAGRVADYMQVDLSMLDSGHLLVQDILAKFGRVDILVNNAALPTEDWNKALAVNVVAPHDLIEAAAADMAVRGYGRVINVTSSSIYSGGTPIPHYVSMKGALDAMTRFLAKKYAPKGILINAVAPGPVLTEMIMKVYTKEQFSEHYISQMPINRFLIPEDIAGTVLFLSSGLCSALCGETLLCDGGRVRLSVK